MSSARARHREVFWVALAGLLLGGCETRRWRMDEVTCTQADTLTITANGDTLAQGTACWEYCTPTGVCFGPDPRDSTKWKPK